MSKCQVCGKEMQERCTDENLPEVKDTLVVGVLEGTALQADPTGLRFFHRSDEVIRCWDCWAGKVPGESTNVLLRQ